MDGFELMIFEHENIKRMLMIIKKMSLKLYYDKAIDYEDYYDVIEFIKNYADKQHHQKEEKYLFTYMINHLGTAGEKVVKNGMLVEHDLGRYYVNKLRLAVDKVISNEVDANVDIIAFSLGYADLLNRHIEKENNIVYQFAKKNLPLNVIDNFNKICLSEKENNKHNKKTILIY